MKLTLPIALLLFSLSAFADPHPTLEKEYQEAALAWEQNRPNSWDKIIQLAEAGHTEALCLIARAYQGNSLMLSEDAQKYFTKAAELGGLCGMIALSNLGSGFKLTADLTEDNGDVNWTKKAIEVTEERVKKNDIDAIKTYAFIKSAEGDFNGYCDWMEKAAELGDADAMKQLAGHIEGGCGWYLIPGSRDKAVKYWLEQAANHGNPRAMTSLAMEKFEDGQFDDMIALFKKAADMGDMNAREMLAGYMAGMDMLDKGLPPEKRDKLLAYTLLYPFFKQLPQTLDAVERSKEVMDKLDKELTEEQKAMARKEAEEWMKTHQVRDYSLVFH